jgi:hypothetical protein
MVKIATRCSRLGMDIVSVLATGKREVLQALKVVPGKEERYYNA